MDDREQQRKIRHRLAVLRHADEVSAQMIPGMQANAAAAFSDLMFLDDDAEPERAADDKEGEQPSDKRRVRRHAERPAR